MQEPTKAGEAGEAQTGRDTTQFDTTLALELAQAQAQTQAQAEVGATEIEMEPVNKAQEHVVEIQFEEDLNDMAKTTTSIDEEAAIGEGEAQLESFDGELPRYQAEEGR